ncbi:MAG TPA: aldo/keto reductase [Blastocatellia bacterium]|nr:aldo/keto reductase [Blastocatellia bacterium]
MKRRRLGNSELEIAPLAFGGNVFGWTVDEQTAFELLDAFVAAGFNLIDTADVYSAWAKGNTGGESESIIGQWLKRAGKRDDVVIATKVGMEMRGEKGLSKSYILRSAEDSLRRLQTDRIDLYQSHQDDPNTPIEETLEAFAELIRQGKVRVIGASNYGAERLNQSLLASERNGLPRYESLQPLYNLYDREPFEAELEPLCLEKNVGVISYFSLARGFLSGKYRSESDLGKSPRGGGVKKYLDERGFRILAALDEVARRLRTTPARAALAWLIARPSVTAPIASATSLEQLSDLIEAARLELDGPSLALLDEASAWRQDSGAEHALKSPMVS